MVSIASSHLNHRNAVIPMAVPTFVDRVTLHVSAGRGGNGVASVHREKFKPLGGPDGGNGGPGGSVILRVDLDVTTLVDYHHSPHRKAENGAQGAGGHRNGSHGADLVLPVPDGTVVHDARSGEVLADLVGPGTELVIARGGRGGLGNAALASAKRKAPGFALLGEPGEELQIRLELKVVADIGLVGFPSAGKSSLIAAISRARPKIADYPFTTLVPNLGVVTAGETTFTVADVPGLIEGASEGRGLGHDFLRHVERCAAIVHVIDTATLEPGRNPVEDLDIIENELTRYGGLDDRPRLVALNKIDVPDGSEIADMVVEELRERGLDVFKVSAASGAGLRELTFAMAGIVQRRPRGASGRGGAAHRDPPAVGRRRRRLQRDGQRRRLAGAGREARALGPPDRLRQRRGRRASSPTGSTGSASRSGWSSWAPEEGDTVLIGHPDDAVVFDFKPSIEAGAEILGRRGEDQRFEESTARGAATPRDRRGDGRPRRVRGPGRRRPAARRGRLRREEEAAHRPDVLRDRRPRTIPTAWRTDE